MSREVGSKIARKGANGPVGPPATTGSPQTCEFANVTVHMLDLGAQDLIKDWPFRVPLGPLINSRDNFAEITFLHNLINHSFCTKHIVQGRGS